jgi:6-phosphogluconolactonase (cycloisomerase 2 family)
MPNEPSMSKESRTPDKQVGHLYTQTNEIKNAIICFHRSANGALTEVDRVLTGGAGSGTFKPISGQESAPNAYEGAASIIFAPDRKLLFTTNGGDNSVSSFRVGEHGKLTLVDCQPTGNPVEGRSGTAKSLAFAPSSKTLLVLHSFGPDHLRLMSVDAEGKLKSRPERYTVNTHDKTNRVSTMVVVSPDEKTVIVGTTFDEPIVTAGLYPDGSPMLWVQRKGGAFHSIASNAPDPDGLAVFPLRQDGSLGTGKMYDAGGGSPFYIAFLHGRPDTFVTAYAVGDGCSISTIGKDGTVSIGPLVKIDTSRGQPSELCWLAVSPDDKTVYATNFGYSNVSSFRISGGSLEVARDPACDMIPGDGAARGLCGDVTSGPSDSWITPDGAYFYQIYANAAKLVGYATQSDGSLSEITSVKIPYNSPQGLIGF